MIMEAPVNDTSFLGNDDLLMCTDCVFYDLSWIFHSRNESHRAYHEAVEGMVIDIICNGKKKDKTYQQLDFPVPRKMTVMHLVGHAAYGSARSNREYA
jgi:hypothetical protein